ncbi:MAG: UvrD-helicase domain-containing protein [Bacteroidales bacterium]|nr:UvrD-helicase domain-containing protein [Bacteroidales bacterium]
MSTGKFLVYKSSAGSGKTTTLVMEYLKIVLNDPGKFSNILALTFTNKAANEMKERVIKSLHELANHDQDQAPRGFLLPKLITETGLDQKAIKSNAEQVLQNILHNYSQFSIGTIDSFVHRIIRSFAFDLNIPVNFEVELDTQSLIDQAVDFLISRVGEDEKLTNALIRFTRDKTGEEKSWDVQRDLQEFAYTLTREDSRPYISKLRDLSLDDFEKIGKTINTEISIFENTMAALGQDAMKVIRNKGLNGDEFYQGRKGIGTYFDNLAEKRFATDIDKLYPNTFVTDTVDQDKWYSKGAKDGDKDAIESVKGQLVNIFRQIQEHIQQKASDYIVFNMLRSQLYSMAVLHEISGILDEIKQQEQILPISEFNEKIAGIVLEQPVPFIYERVGEKYRHYLLDEFQDTSVLQWQNLVPLLENSLSANQFNLVVGDGKQAIYRWRNGEVEQFLQLPAIYRKKGSFQQEREQTLKQHYKEAVLDKNFRSRREIVDFNNDFFTSIAQHLPDDAYKELYRNAAQELGGKAEDGYVHIEFLPKAPRQEFREMNLEKVESHIGELRREGYRYSDIAILCRSNIDASEIARHLLNQGISVISAESLLLKSSPEVGFITALLQLMINPSDKVLMAEVIDYLANAGKTQSDDLHREFSIIGKGKQEGQQEFHFEEDHHAFNDFLEILHDNQLDFPVEALRHLPLYDQCEALIRNFGLDRQPDAYLQFFLDAVLDYTTKRNARLEDFLEWWADEKEKRSVVIPEGTDAVHVMTIHKAKGLQFPVVIYPMATMKIKNSKDAVWVDFKSRAIPEMKTAMLPMNKSLNYTDFAPLYQEEERKSALDFVNMLYVTMTRPVEQLFIITNQPSKSSGPPKSVADFFKWYLGKKQRWDENTATYAFGKKPAHTSTDASSGENQYKPAAWLSSDWRKTIMIKGRAPDYWDVEDPAAGRDWGNLVHAALAKINAPDDVQGAVDAMFEEGLIDEGQKEALATAIDRLLQRPEIKPFFEAGLNGRNESEILLPGGDSYRPDRIIFKTDETWIVDYKTGHAEESHKKQLKRYGELLKQMGYATVRMFLIYVDGEEPVVETEGLRD